MPGITELYIANWASRDAVAHGRLLFEGRRVRLMNWNRSGFTAVVQEAGGRRCFVQVYFEDGAPTSGGCDCYDEADQADDERGPCMHTVAALLEYEYQLPTSGLRIVHRELPPPEPDWKKELNQVEAAEHRAAAVLPEEHPAAAEAREFMYIVDLPATVQGEGSLKMQVAHRERKANGEWGTPKPRRVESLEITTVHDPLDRQALAMLRGLVVSPYSGYYSYGSSGYDYSTQRIKVESASSAALLPAMCATGRCFVSMGKSPDSLIGPMIWDGGQPWALWLRVRADEAGENYVVDGCLRRDGQELKLAEAGALLASGIVFIADRVARFEHSGAWSWVPMLRKRGSLAVPVADRAALLTKLMAMPVLPKLDLPEELRIEELAVEPKPVLRVRSPKSSEYPATKLVAYIQFNYDGLVAGMKERRRMLFDAERQRLIRRDAHRELQFHAQLQTVGFKAENGYSRTDGDYRILQTKFAKTVRMLVADGWHVEAEGKLYRQPGKFDIEVTSGIDWFDLTAKVDFDGVSVGLPKLLSAVKKGDGMVVLDDGSMGMLPEDWLKKYGFIAGAGEAEGDSIRFRKSQAGLLDALLASQPEARCDATFGRMREEMRSFEGIKPKDPPATFIGELRPYQRDAQGWFDFLQRFSFGGCLADDMGLGKTVQVLALLEARRQAKDRRPSLVVVPRSLVFNWKQEAERFAPKLRVLDQTGNDRVRDAGHLGEYDLVITTYGTLRRDVTYLRDLEFDYVILDEAQAIKNASTDAAKATRLLTATHRLALSGTPVQNHLGDLWSLFDFLNPGMLGTASVFSKMGVGAKSVGDDTKEMLSRVLRPFILRRTKEQVAKDLPAKLEQTIYCELEGDQRKLYDELRDHYRQSLMKMIDAKGIGRSKIQILEALLRLRQAALHPGLIDKSRAGEESAKLDMLLPRLEEVLEEGHKALVFSQFTEMLAILRKKLDAKKVKYEYLDGKTVNRQACVERFQSEGGCKLFLISLKAGGLGLNLTAADYVFLLDPWWNPAVEQQAIDRAHRIGQDKQVFACRLIAKDTVEEKVLALQQSKRDLADAIITADNSVIRTIGRADIELLLS